MAVTDANKADYLLRLARSRVLGDALDSVDCIRAGLRKVIPATFLRVSVGRMLNEVTQRCAGGSTRTHGIRGKKYNVVNMQFITVVYLLRK